MLDVFSIPEVGSAALSLRGERLINWLLFTSLGVAVPLAVLYSGFSARMRNVVARFVEKPWLAAMVFYVAYVLLEALLLTPVAYFRGYELLRDYGILQETPWQWFAERMGRTAAQGLMVAPILAFGLWLVRVSPRRWWLWATVAVAPWLLAVTVVYPYAIEPLFTRSVPLAEGKLKREVDRMAQAAGVPIESILVVQESGRSRSINAIVSGVGSAVRIRVYDNLLTSMDTREVRHVLAHELGHHRLHHLWFDMALGLLMAGGVLFFVSRRAPASIERNGDLWGFDSLHDYAAIPLVVFWFNVAQFAVSPLQNYYMRWQEAEADAYALALLRDPVACATTMRKLGNLAVPDPQPLEQAMRGTHPTVAERLERCRAAVGRI